MNKSLKGKIAFITGSASGIGLQIAKTFAQEGAKVVISDMNKEKSDQVAEELNEQGFIALSAPCDVTNEEAYKNSLEQAYKTFGRIDILVNNAGLQYVAPIEEFPTEKFELLSKSYVDCTVYWNQKRISNHEGTRIWKSDQYGFH